MAKQSKPSLPDLQRHLAFEVHYLAWTAKAFAAGKGKTKVALQDSALLHGRNLLEFSKPMKRPGYAWWIGDFAAVPTNGDRDYWAWFDFVHGKVLHMGDNRVKSPRWPVPLDGHECEAVARYCLKRIENVATSASPRKAADRDALSSVVALVKLGLAYLDSGDVQHLKALQDFFTP